MRVQEALQKLRALDLTKYGVKHLELSGSTARDQAEAESDLDVQGRWNYLEAKWGIQVNLVIKDLLRPYVDPEVVRVA